MAVQPQRHRVLHEVLDDRRGITRGQTLFHLAGELRLLDLHRQHVAGLVPDILRRELDAAGNEVAEFAELAHGAAQARAQTVHVRAALDRSE